MSNNDAGRVLDFVAQFCRVPREQLNADTKLAQDLGLDGDEAAEFMAAFSEEFRVNIATFQFDQHFFSEGEPFVRWLWFRVFSPTKLKRIPIALSDLVSAVHNGRWHDKS